MKRKSVVCTSILLFLNLCTFVNKWNYTDNTDYHTINLIFDEIKLMSPEFRKSKIDEIVTIGNDIDYNEYYLVKTKEEEMHSGYFVLDNEYSFLVSHPEYTDSFPDSSKRYYYHSSLSITDERKPRKFIKKVERKPVVKQIYTQYILPTVNENVYNSYTSSYGSSISIEGVPEYYNSNDPSISSNNYTVFKNGGCSPTAGAMFLAFYDKKCSAFENLFTIDMPMKHEYNVDLVNSVIAQLGECMHTDTETGATYSNMITTGINSFMAQRDCTIPYFMRMDTATASSSSDGEFIYSSASSIINQRNIAILNIKTDFSNDTGHSVVLTGVNNYRYTGKSLQVHYGWEGQSNYTIKPNQVYGIQYLGLRL